MSEKVVSFEAQKDAARHKRKERKLDAMQARFEKALPTEKSSKDKLLDIFRKGKPKK